MVERGNHEDLPLSVGVYAEWVRSMFGYLSAQPAQALHQSVVPRS